MIESRIGTFVMDSNTTVVVCGQQQREAWEAYIAKSSAATICHSFVWRSIIAEAYGLRPVYLMAVQDGNVRGVLPLFVVKSLWFGRIMSSIPFLDYGGICADDSRTSTVLLSHARDLMAEFRADCIELRQCDKPPGNDNLHLDKVGMRLDISLGLEELWRSFPTKIRNHIRKAEKSGLKVVSGGGECLDEFYPVFAANMRDLSSPVHDREFFARILAELGPSVKMFLVRDGQRTVGGLICLFFRDSAVVFWSSSLREYFPRCPNNLLYWAALQYAYSQGCQWFDFGRSSVGSGTYEFKSQWGAKPFQIYWQITTAHGEARSPISGDNSKYRLAMEVWKRLPLGLTIFVGSRLRKFITN
jgi:FemAB-related protein (PEP-CTERM system-associated)